MATVNKTLTEINSIFDDADYIFSGVSKEKLLSNAKVPITIKSKQHQLCVFGNSISQSINNFGTWFCRKLDGAVVFKTNAGVGGNTTVDMVARLSDIDGSLVTVMEATNDAVSDVTLSTHTANIKTTLEYAIDNQVLPIMIMSPPHDTLARSQYVFEANLYDYVTARNKGIPCFNPWSELVNDDGDGSWAVGASTDGTHPDPVAEKAAGYKLADDFTFNKFYVPLPIFNNYTVSNAILNPNALFLTDDNSDGTPNNWATNGSQTTRTLTNTSLGLGNTFTTTWLNTQIFMNSSRWDVTEGETYLCVMRYESIVNSGTPLISAQVEYDAPIAGVDRRYFVREVAVSVEPTTLSVEITIPAGVSSLRFSVTASTGTHDVEIRIAQAQIFNLTHYGL